MEFLKEFPEWLSIGTIALLSAVIGFFGRRLFDALNKTKNKKNIAIRQLELLQILLEKSNKVLKEQTNLACRLYKLIVERYGDEVSENLRYEEVFYNTYDQMKKEEKELFHVIRGTTIHSVYRLNEKLREWTDDHTAKQLIGQSVECVESLDKKLMQLKLHLNGWFAKYEAIIKSSGKSSFVDLSDENKYGFGFPNDLSEQVEDLLSKIKAGRLRRV